MTDKQRKNLEAPPEKSSDKSVDGLNKKKPLIITIILILVFLGFLFKTDVFNPEPGIRVTGKITSPQNKTKTGKQITIKGETKNVGADQYIWLVQYN